MIFSDALQPSHAHRRGGIRQRGVPESLQDPSHVAGRRHPGLRDRPARGQHSGAKTQKALPSESRLVIFLSIPNHLFLSEKIRSATLALMFNVFSVPPWH